MSKKRHPAFLKLILEKFETALDIFNVDLTVDNSQASNNKCRSEIFEAMRMFCDDGLHGANVAIKQSIRNWVVDTAITVLSTEIEKCQSSKMHAKMMSGKAIGPYDLLLHLFGCRTHKNHGAAYHEFLLQEFRLANYLGTLYTEKDCLSAAEKYFNHAMLIGKKFLRKNHAAILAIMSNLALICKRHNNYEKAEELYNFCLKEKNQELGSSHPSTLVTAFNLAVCIKHRGDSETALSMMLSCLTDQEVELGLDHPDTMHTLENVASILLELKRNEEAHRLLQKSTRNPKEN
jgi:tetratricopeptide (TPR) repeat protein